MRFEQVENRRAYRVIIDQVADRIQRGLLLPGDRLAPENELCVEFGVSRATLREALSALEALGLVQTLRGSRSIVLGSHAAPQSVTEAKPNELNPWSPVDMWEARRLIEPGAAALAAVRRQKSDLLAMEQALDTYLQKGEQGALRAPYAFDLHVRVAQATQNSAVVSMLTAAAQREPTRWERAMKRMSPILETHRGTYAAQHRTIVDTIRAGQADAAFEAMDSHIQSIIRDLT